MPEARQKRERKATPTVLLLPELRSLIFEHLDAKSLYAAVRVCRSWAADALPHLWHQATDRALASCPSYGGLNYAAMVRELSVVARFPSAEVLRHWPFLPHLRRLKIGTKAFWDEIDDEESDERGDFTFLWEVCRSALSPLHVEIGTVLYPGEFNDGIWNYDSLPHGMYSLIASSCDVVSFDCLPFIDTEEVASAMAGIHSASGPFRNLERLNVKISDDSAQLLFSGPVLQTLTSLHLGIVAGTDNVLSAVSGLVKLRILYVDFMNCDEVEFAASELLSLSTVSELREFYVWCDITITAPDFTDPLLAQVVACWPHLRVWDVPIYANLSPAAFRLIGEHCRELRQLTMYSPSTLLAFEPPKSAALTPLFPKLRTLTLRETVGLDPTGLNYFDQSLRAITLASTICTRAPALESLAFWGSNSIEELVKEHIAKYWATQLKAMPKP